MKSLNFLNKIIYFINIVVAFALLFSYILPFLPPKTFAVLSVLNLGVSFLIILNILFATYWLIRLKRQFVLSFLVLFIGYLSYGSLYKFSTSKEVEHSGNFKVMNYNVRLFNLYDWIKEDAVETKIVDFIKTQAPDVLSVQEYHPHKNIDLSFFKHKFEKLSGKKTKYGQAIFSQFPIVNSGSIEFPDTGNNAIFADVVKGNDTIRVYNIHLESLRISADVEDLKNEDSERLLKRVGSTFKMQQFQTELFLMHKKQCKHNMVICGDFNNTAFSYVYRKIKGDLQDTFKAAGSGFGRTYDFKFFPVRIDFIFADEAFSVNGFESYTEPYSDHFPIMTTLSLRDE
ncbi:endonuclease/exonuclease/phosphatase family protein [Seonamhaeicola sp.]|uniref:endonuclease/exonuclease/phosphatase family protein n=1 Tax=Seonamhaeicola sp. TaxID=1912245 RepID=UPI0026398AE7|nr:endonuclease/exonuclease/phosphatase family protein [Seonamhaeicola sp.]